MRVAFLGGGTGGHLAPGLGVAAVLARRGHEAHFLVAGRTVERAMLEPRSLGHTALFGPGGRPPVWRLDRWLAAGRRLARALSALRPDVLVVLGGWVALPLLWTSGRGRPVVLVETNARAGRVQRTLSGRAAWACLAVDGPDMPRGRRGTRVTGVPVPVLAGWDRDEACRHLGLDPARRTLLVLGGSQGARDLDALVEAAAGRLAAARDPWQVLHVMGPGREPPAGGRDGPVAAVRLHRLGFVPDMAPVWAATDLALCRAGAGTVAELAATGTPAVLVPYPHHADGHQAANGAPLIARGRAWMVPADDPTGRRTVPGLLDAAVGALASGVLDAPRPRAATEEAAVAVADVIEGAMADARCLASLGAGP